METIPTPRDIPLPMPANPTLLHLLLVFAFIAHILFVNLMVGGTLLVFGFQLRGLSEPDFDHVARRLAMTITVNKSLAVVLGVAPLLLINVLYTIHFYTANALTGTAWAALVPLISATFLLLYLHKYTWESLKDQRRLHIAIGALPAVLFLIIPLIFLANVNLMMFPERWSSVRGFLSSLMLPNVFPRYFHFLSASLIATSLFGVWHFGKRELPELNKLNAASLRRTFYAIAFAVSLAQFVFGPLVLFTLPSNGFNTQVILSILTGAALAIPAVWLIWMELRDTACSGQRFRYIVGYLSITVFCMAVGRHLYRGVALADHKRAMTVATEQWIRDSEQAAYDLRTGQARAASGVSEGQHLFETTCGACHAVDTVLVGPPLTEIAQIYSSNSDGIVTWAKAPGKKRQGVPPMPPFAALGEPKLKAIADYMLTAGAR